MTVNAVQTGDTVTFKVKPLQSDGCAHKTVAVLLPSPPVFVTFESAFFSVINKQT